MDQPHKSSTHLGCPAQGAFMSDNLNGMRGKDITLKSLRFCTGFMHPITRVQVSAHILRADVLKVLLGFPFVMTKPRPTVEMPRMPGTLPAVRVAIGPPSRLPAQYSPAKLRSDSSARLRICRMLAFALSSYAQKALKQPCISNVSDDEIYHLHSLSMTQPHDFELDVCSEEDDVGVGTTSQRADEVKQAFIEHAALVDYAHQRFTDTSSDAYNAAATQHDCCHGAETSSGVEVDELRRRKMLSSMPALPSGVLRVVQYFCQYAVATRLMVAQMWPLLVTPSNESAATAPLSSGLARVSIRDYLLMQQNASSFSGSKTTAMLLFDVLAQWDTTCVGRAPPSLQLRACLLSRLVQFRRLLTGGYRNPHPLQLAIARTEYTNRTLSQWREVRRTLEANYTQSHETRASHCYFFAIQDAQDLVTPLAYHHENIAAEDVVKPSNASVSHAFVLYQYWLPGRTRPHMLILQSHAGLYQLSHWMMQAAAIQASRAEPTTPKVDASADVTTHALVKISPCTLFFTMIGQVARRAVAANSSQPDVRKTAKESLSRAVEYRVPLLAEESDAENDLKFRSLLNELELVLGGAPMWNQPVADAYARLFGRTPSRTIGSSMYAMFSGPQQGTNAAPPASYSIPSGFVFKQSTNAGNQVTHENLNSLEALLCHEYNIETIGAWRADQSSSASDGIVSSPTEPSLLARNAQRELRLATTLSDVDLTALIE